MSELPRAARDVLRQVRQAHDPNAADVERSLSRLQASLSFGVDAVPPSAQVAQPVATTTSHGAGSALFTAKALKLCVVAVALGGSITGAMMASRAPAPPARMQSIVTAAEVSARAIPPDERQSVASLAPPVAASRAVAHEPRKAATAPRLAAHARAALKHEVPPAVQAPPEAVESSGPPSASSASELDLIGRAATSLRDGQLQRALRLLDEHRALYPAGLLQTEQQGLRVLALCGLGQVEQANQARTDFLRHAGRTPLAARVRRACAEPPEP